MAFLRKKKIKGKIYYYLVENKLVEGKVRQRVLMYLGTADNIFNKLKANSEDKILISDKRYLEAKKEKMLKDGAQQLHIIADFDKTLTKAFVNGEKIASIIGELRERDFIDPEYSKDAKALFEKYHKYEIDPKMSYEEKQQKMEEWWKAHYDILINKYGITKKHLEKVVNEGNIEFRKGVLEFLDSLNKYKIPLIIISSSGIGDAIPLFLQRINRKYPNIFVVSNFFEWDKKGKATKVKEPIIHSMNKSETTIEEIPQIYETIKSRKNVILLGDGIGDISMVKGFVYESLIKIGFLNEKVEERLEEFKQNFDLIILNDGSLEPINKILKEIVEL